jgi:Flp pilus assembly protein TadD
MRQPGGRLGLAPAVLFVFTLMACAQQSRAPGSLSESVANIESPATVEPQATETYLSLGKRLLAAREPDLAMKAFVASMTKEGISAEAMTGAGIAAQQQGLLTSAQRYFIQARELAPNSVITHNNLGVVLYLLEEYYPAREEFRTAYALSSGRNEMAERNLNRVEETIAGIEQVAETNTAISHDVVRLGSSEFRLVESASPEVEVIAE